VPQDKTGDPRQQPGSKLSVLRKHPIFADLEPEALDQLCRYAKHTTVKRGATIFLTSHVLEVVERLCDRVAIIHEGKIVTEGTLDELRAGSETLEDVFVRVVGAERAFERLEWL